MFQKDFRTYHRRKATRNSGYHTCDDTTGGECLVLNAERYICNDNITTFIFHRNYIELVELFEQGISIIAFGGYIYSKKEAILSLELSYIYEGRKYNTSKKQTLYAKTWLNIGIHDNKIINKDFYITDLTIKMSIQSTSKNELDFISFDLDVIKKDEFLDSSCAKSFYQKTNMHIPYLYYLRSDLSINKYLKYKQQFIKGKYVVLKSCNRCGRYLPINIDNELNTLSFSLHCKKGAPCKHSTFNAYNIKNQIDLTEKEFNLPIQNNKIISYYGHQLECKACKKFFVNAPLNPQRNAQQFKEDGLRRRAIENLVNTLLEKNIIHLEFEYYTHKSFSQHIWEKFNKRCFKCGPNSVPISLNEMALDHTMPLAYLYRLDETATCLCKSHNSQKSDHFPVDYYNEDELIRLSKITGLSLEQLHKKEINQKVLNLLIENISWFYDDFLMNPKYQEIRDGIRTADKINDSLKRVIAGKVDLAEIYRNKTGHYPYSVTIK